MAAEVATWTVDENLRFENSLQETEQLGDTAERWIIVAEAVGNGRTATEVRHYYLQLVDDINGIAVTLHE